MKELAVSMLQASLIVTASFLFLIVVSHRPLETVTFDERWNAGTCTTDSECEDHEEMRDALERYIERTYGTQI
jgi:hypothetical protein